MLKTDKKVINFTLLVEVLNAVKKSNYDEDVSDLLDCLLNLEVDYLDVSDYKDAMEWFKHFDRSINFSDCTIVNSMINNKITKIVSFDSDFDKIAGFERIH